ncbi:hypothetical protein [Streptomyces sp. R41]|uniref:Uncharacterized protein n=1 Tax=Streptomyces sp. R41 TaxID=3238632 RepID=A0AB39RPC2_9ACTN
MRAQQQVQRHALLGALGGPLAEQAQVGAREVRIAGAAQEQADAVPGRRGDLQVLHVVRELRITGERLEGIAGHSPGQLVDPGLTAQREHPAAAERVTAGSCGRTGGL